MWNYPLDSKHRVKRLPSVPPASKINTCLIRLIPDKINLSLYSFKMNYVYF